MNKFIASISLATFFICSSIGVSPSYGEELPSAMQEGVEGFVEINQLVQAEAAKQAEMDKQNILEQDRNAAQPDSNDGELPVLDPNSKNVERTYVTDENGKRVLARVYITWNFSNGFLAKTQESTFSGGVKDSWTTKSYSAKGAQQGRSIVEKSTNVTFHSNGNNKLVTLTLYNESGIKVSTVMTSYAPELNDDGEPVRVSENNITYYADTGRIKTTNTYTWGTMDNPSAHVTSREYFELANRKNTQAIPNAIRRTSLKFYADTGYLKEKLDIKWRDPQTPPPTKFDHAYLGHFANELNENGSPVINTEFAITYHEDGLTTKFSSEKRRDENGILVSTTRSYRADETLDKLITFRPDGSKSSVKVYAADGATVLRVIYYDADGNIIT